ncbi:MAG: PTS sugar transporter subunit IIA [Candidatus Omnitrophica bacterium]|nr:PTS sugar transporter subunit IIA [Candidatus Omnitrophota bacterium]
MHKDIRLSRVLKENLIDLELQSKNKNEAISQLVELLSKSRKIKNKKLFLKAMLERERLGSTGIGNGVAIPHAKSEGVGDFIIAFARKDSGIDFGALDGEKTYLFFAMASSKNEVGAHLKVLAQISSLVRDKFIVELLRRAKNRKEILKIISDAEKHA